MLTGFVEGGVKRDGDGDEDGGEEDEDVPARLGHAVVAQHPPRPLRHRRLVLGQRLDVGRRRREQGLQWMELYRAPPKDAAQVG